MRRQEGGKQRSCILMTVEEEAEEQTLQRLKVDSESEISLRVIYHLSRSIDKLNADTFIFFFDCRFFFHGPVGIFSVFQLKCF